jgi:hypothetical protein
VTIEEYADAQAVISAALVREVLTVTQEFQGPQMNNSLWIQLLRLLFPLVLRRRQESAALARRFYDEQRELHHPDLPPHNIYLAEYRLEWFLEAMEPARAEFLGPGASDESSARVALRAMKEVENGGRKTMLRVIEDEDDDVRDQVVEGWARVATGRETCEFCLMLVSRGPVYESARSAGFRADDELAIDILHNGTEADIKKLMTRWHEGCDCKVVPVFDRASWPGRDAFKRAQKVWIKYSKMVDKDPKLRIPENGNQRGPNDRKWSRSEAIMAAIRRAFYNGEIDPRSYSIAA